MIIKFRIKSFFLYIQCILKVDFELMSSICEIFTDERTQWNTRTLCAKHNREKKVPTGLGTILVECLVK